MFEYHRLSTVVKITCAGGWEASGTLLFGEVAAFDKRGQVPKLIGDALSVHIARLQDCALLIPQTVRSSCHR